MLTAQTTGAQRDCGSPALAPSRCGDRVRTSSGVLGVIDVGQNRILNRLVAAAVTFVALLLVGAARLVVDRAAPGVLPQFALLYPAVLAVSLLAGWRSGLAVLALGALFNWTIIMNHPFLRSGGVPPNAGEVVTLAFFAFTAGLVIAVAQAYRVAASRVRAHEAQTMDESLDLTTAATATAGLGVWEWRGEGPIIASVQAKVLCGIAAEHMVTPEALLEMIAPDSRAAAVAQARRALDPATTDLSAYEFEIVTGSGDTRWLAVSGQAVSDEQGRRRLVGAVIDITARKAAEAALSAAADRLQISEAGRLAVWRVDPALGLIHDEDLNAIYGLPEDARMTPEDVRSFYLPGELERIRAVTVAAWARGQRSLEVEARIRRVDGDERWVMVRGELGLNAEGHPRAAIGVTMDITERKEAEARLNLVAEEVSHRADNLMAVVQGTVRLSQAPTPDSPKEVAPGRIAALPRAHQMPRERFELGALVEEELRPYCLAQIGRMVMEGPATPLSPAAAQALALTLHELATNAVKYGALSVAGGRVSVTWVSFPGGPLELVWSESGGPAVRKPMRLGQGTILLTQALAGPLGGSAVIEWRRSGLACTLRLPATALEDAAAPA